MENQILPQNKRDAIINECGIRDHWPVIAKSVSWDYGASGTYGFGSFNVRDRFHPLGHSGYFETDFVRQYWVPAVAGKPIDFSITDTKGEGSPFWFGMLRIPFRWLIVVGAPVLIAIAAIPLVQHLGICLPGKEYRDGTCVAVRQLKSKREIAARISDLLVDIKKTLDLKQGVLFPRMQTFLNDSTDENWDRVRSSANSLHTHVEKSLDEITTYDAHLVRDGSNVILIASDARVAIDGRYWEAFSGARKMFEGRDAIFLSMMSAQHAPDPDLARQWYDKLVIMHENLADMLRELLNLLDRA